MKNKKLLKTLATMAVGTVMAAASFGMTACGHKHTFSEEWSKDATNHWHVATCDHKDEIDGLEAHKDENKDDKCDVCGYVMKTSSDNPGTNPETPGTNPETPTATVTGVTVAVKDNAAAEVKVGETLELTATVTGTNNPAQTVTWSTSDPSVATVNAGVVTGVKAGTVTITATSTVDTSKKGEKTITVKADTPVNPNPNPGASSTESFLVADTAIGPFTVGEEDGPAQITDNDLFTVKTEVSMQHARGKNSGDDQDIGATVTLQDGNSNTFNYGLKQSEKISERGEGKSGSLFITAKENISLRLYVNLINDSYNSTRTGKIYYSVGGGLMGTVDSVSKTEVQVVEVTIAKDEIVTVYAVPGAGQDDSKLWFFGAEAKTVESVTAPVATSITITKGTKGYVLSGSELEIPVDDVVITAKDASNNTYALDPDAWDISYVLSKDGSNLSDLKVTEGGTYKLTVTATPIGGGSPLSDHIDDIEVDAPILTEHTYKVTYTMTVDSLAAAWENNDQDKANNITVELVKPSYKGAKGGYDYSAEIKSDRNVKVSVGANLADVAVTFKVVIGNADRNAFFGTDNSQTASGYIAKLAGDANALSTARELSASNLSAGDYLLYADNSIYFVELQITYTINKGVH